VSLLGQRLLATIAALWVVAFATAGALAVALPDSTWIALTPLPNQPRTPIFALAVDPSNNQVVLAGDSQGALLRSANGGGAWTVVRTGKSYITTVSFSPFTKGVVLAGTRGGGALLSRDGGATWLTVRGLDGRVVRVFGFALALIAAGTDHGVYTSTDGSSWSQAGLANRSINALAVEAIHEPVRLVAGSDADVSASGLPLYQTLDAGLTWKQLAPAIGGTIVTRLAAGPLPPTGNIRPLLVGTNTGLFASKDNGTTFTALSGGGLLPTTDYTQAGWITNHYDRYYVASDGGGSGTGGVWKSSNAGQTFSSMRTPEASVTALAVSYDEKPIVYIATFKPSTHTAELWALHDTGGIPQGPSTSPSPLASGARKPSPPARSLLDQLMGSPELPYIGLGLGALAVVLTAVVAHLRGRQR
jgi:photosystem II stability/assembly factor-like uncharacterized protein